MCGRRGGLRVADGHRHAGRCRGSRRTAHQRPLWRAELPRLPVQAFRLRLSRTRGPDQLSGRIHADQTPAVVALGASLGDGERGNRGADGGLAQGSYAALRSTRPVRTSGVHESKASLARARAGRVQDLSRRMPLISALVSSTHLRCAAEFSLMLPQLPGPRERPLPRAAGLVRRRADGAPICGLGRLHALTVGLGAPGAFGLTRTRP
jgi:hypothetical protein